MNKKNFLTLLGSVLIATWLTGCATSRSVVSPSVAAGQNPSHGVAVRIEKVEDARVFQIAPPQPSIPSLKDDDIHNSEVTARAFGRKRNTYGMALGDVLLPEGQSVARLTQTALTRALRESGYRVVTPVDPDYAQAVPVTAKIDQFWAWLRPGFWAIALEFRTDVALRGDIPAMQTGQVISGQTRNTMQLATENDWMEIVNKGLDDFVVNARRQLEQK